MPTRAVRKGGGAQLMPRAAKDAHQRRMPTRAARKGGGAQLMHRAGKDAHQSCKEGGRGTINA